MAVATTHMYFTDAPCMLSYFCRRFAVNIMLFAFPTVDGEYLASKLILGVYPTPVIEPVYYTRSFCFACLIVFARLHITHLHSVIGGFPYMYSCIGIFHAQIVIQSRHISYTCTPVWSASMLYPNTCSALHYTAIPNPSRAIFLNHEIPSPVNPSLAI